VGKEVAIRGLGVHDVRRVERFQEGPKALAEKCKPALREDD
jgi:hypothetical protein